jgi:DNA-binding transcriptional LysR family regulator
MEIRVLRYFLAVAREGTISGAAQTLHMSQPTLSRQLMDMEDRFGKKLFIRGNRHISLTEDGMLLRKRAEEIIDLVDKTETEMAASSEILSGEIYIGAGETQIIRPIIKIAKELQEDCPGISYHLFSGNAEDVTEKLDKGLLDFGLVLGTPDNKKYNHLKLPVTDSWGVLMRKDSPLAKKEFVIPEDLWNVPLICSRQGLFKKNAVANWLKKDMNKLNIVSTYNLIFNAAIMVEEGFGYALSLDKLVKTTDNDVLCFKPFKPPLEIDANIIWKKYQVFSQASEEFLQRLHKSFS